MKENIYYIRYYIDFLEHNFSKNKSLKMDMGIFNFLTFFNIRSALNEELISKKNVKNNLIIKIKKLFKIK